METIYIGCAVIGGTVLVLQFIVSSLGIMGHDAETSDQGSFEHDLDGAFFKLLSLKTVVAFLTFFGLTGMATERAGMAAPMPLLLALGAGSLALFVVAWLMAAFARLQTRGNVDLRNALGSTARVYLRIPGANLGRGKVTISVQGRTVEAKAITAGDELPTGSMVQILAVVEPDTVEVAAAAQPADAIA